MSLIERALGKAKGAAAPVAPSSGTAQRPVVKSSDPRTAAEPKLRVTAAMRDRLGLKAAEDLEHQRASEYRHIKRQIIAEIRANPEQRVILVASALAGEGKSYTAANLARSLATERDFSVLLIDADVVKPQLSRAMDLVDRPGLMNALVDDNCDVDSLILSTDIDGLSVLPAGSSSEYATEHFGSDRMRMVIEHLQSVPNRIILVDSLPLLLTTEARVLLPLASQVLLVVRSESTPQSAVRQAVDLLGENANVKLILNAVFRSRLTSYLGYGYGFDYNYLPKK